MSTPNLGLETVPSNSLQPSVPINAALQVLDALVQLVIEDLDLTAPPVTTGADTGRRWVVGPAATGAWSGHDDEIALCTGANLWRFIVPQEGWRGYVLDVGEDFRFTGSGGWVSLGV